MYEFKFNIVGIYSHFYLSSAVEFITALKLKYMTIDSVATRAPVTLSNLHFPVCELVWFFSFLECHLA